MSPFILGIVASEKTNLGAYELIQTVNGTGSSATISFASVLQTYKHLQIRWTAKGTATSETRVRMRFNNDAGASYAWHYIKGQGSSVFSSYFGAANTAISLIDGITFAVTANVHAVAIADILDYSSTTKNKTSRVMQGYTNGGMGSGINLTSGLWMNTAAITSIDIISDGGNFTTTSRFSLYGIKG